MRNRSVAQRLIGAFVAAALAGGSIALVAGQTSADTRVRQTNSDATIRQRSEGVPFPIPVGTILPVQLTKTISTRTAQVSQAVSARIMQNVPLPNGAQITQGSKVTGRITAVTKPGHGAGGSISLRFEQVEVHHQTIPLVAGLRAVASVAEVRDAQTPETGPDRGTSPLWVTTRQIGGDEVYGVGGPVTDRNSNRVGKAVNGGVLVRPGASTDSNCRGAIGDAEQLQAMWLFSADACGVYGFNEVTITHAGRTDPLGEIRLSSQHGELKIPAATAMLLRVIG